MSPLEWLREHGPALALGVSLVLAAAAVATFCARSPAARRRLAGLGLLAAALFLALAAVPLPRLAPVGLRGEAPPPRARDGAAASAPAAPEPTEPAGASEAAVPPRSATAGEPPRRPVGPPAPDAAPAAAPGLPRAAQAVPWASWAARAFALGAALCALRLLLGWLRLRAILRRSRPAPEPLLRAAGLPARIAVRIAGRSVRPFCCGLLRPHIVLPPDLAQPSPLSLMVLRHEAAHLRAGDLRAQAIAALLQPLLFWQPLYWWLAGQLRFASELLADDVAARASVSDYVRCMLTLAERPEPRAAAPVAASVFHRPSEFYRRLQMLLSREGPLSVSQSPLRRCVQTLAAAALAAGCAGWLGVAPARAQEPAGRAEVEQQARELRDEIARLKQQLAELRRELAQQGDGILGTQLTEEELDAVRTGRYGGGLPVDGQGRTFYTVKSGDSLDSIARTVYGSSRHAKKILQANPGLDAQRLRIGSRLYVTGTRRDPLAQDPPARFDSGTVPPGGAAPVPRDPDGEAGAKAATSYATDGAGDRPLSELADLVTRFIELRGQVRIAELRLRKGFADETERSIAAVELETRQQQLHAIQSLLDGELERMQDELTRLRMLHERGYVTAAEVDRLEQRVKFLRSAR